MMNEGQDYEGVYMVSFHMLSFWIALPYHLHGWQSTNLCIKVDANSSESLDYRAGGGWERTGMELAFSFV